MKIIRLWWNHPAEWWQFWFPQSGLVGGLVAGFSGLALSILLLKAVAAEIPQEQKVSIEAFQKARAEGAANRQEAMKACRKVAVERPVKSPVTVIEEQAAAYEGCMTAKGFKK